MSFRRLDRWHWLMGISALALLLVMASDWYATKFADSLRRDEGLAVTGGALSGEPGRALQSRIPEVAERLEQNAWQAYWAPDLGLLVLLLLVGAILAGVGAAYARAADVKVDVLGGASTIVAGVGSLAILGVLLRLVDQPGLDEITTVRGGPFLGLLALGVMVFAASRAMKAERAAGSSGRAGSAPRVR